MEAVVSLPAGDGLTAAACDALGVARATVYRHRARRAAPLAPPPSRPHPPRALTPEERHTVLDLLREPRFADLAPAEVYATLLDEGVYHCSIRTMYRILLCGLRTNHERAANSLVTNTGQLDLLATRRSVMSISSSSPTRVDWAGSRKPATASGPRRRWRCSGTKR